jgi:hypothetical protein
MLGPAVVFILGPHTIYSTNTGEFAASFGELLTPWLVRSVLANWGILFAIGCVCALVSERLTRVYAAVLLGLGLLLWGQGNLWNADYGALTGDEIDFAAHAWRSPYELTAWAGFLLFLIVFFRPVSRIAPFAALVFIGVQVSAAVVMGAGPGAAERGRWTDPPPAIYEFSAKQNVIHVVLDAFQSDVFAGIMEEDRAAFNRHFSGFEYFADHAGAFPTTSFSMAAMLTGEAYRNQQPAPQFVRDAFKRSSIFRHVSQAGYDIDVMSIVPLPTLDEWLGPESAPNWKGARFQIRRPFVSRREYGEASARQLLELSVFRHVPHAWKAAALDHPDAVNRLTLMPLRESPARVRAYQASNSAAFFTHFTQTMTVRREQPIYKVVHVGVPHRPVVVDRECGFIGVKRVTRETYAEQARCAVRLVTAFLDRLRALGIYDGSLIVISSDHGTGLRPRGFNGRSDSVPLAPGSSSRLTTIAGTAKALMLIKPPHRSGPLTISTAPTSHLDLPSTILDVLDLPVPSTDSSMFQRDPARARVRSFGMYDLRERFPKGYLRRLDELTIEGRVVDAERWRMQRSIWRPDLTLAATDVDAGASGGDPHIGPGWTTAQRESAEPSRGVTFVRAVTRRAVLFASLPSGRHRIVLRAGWPAGRGPLAANVSVDESPITRIDFPSAGGYRDLTIDVAANSARPRISQIALEFETRSAESFVFNLDRLVLHDGQIK